MGTDKLKIYSSFNYFNQNAVLKTTSLRRYSGRINLEYRFTKWLKFSSSNMYTVIYANNPSMGHWRENSNEANYTNAALYFSPRLALTQDDGTLTLPENALSINPKKFELIKDKTTTKRLFFAPNLEVQFTPWLKGNVQLSVDETSEMRDVFSHKATRMPQQNQENYGGYSNAYNNNYGIEEYLTFDKRFGSDHYLTPFTEEQSMENVWAIPSGSQGDNEFFYYTIPSNCSYVCGMDVAPYWGVVTMPWEFYETFTANDVRKKGIGDHYTGPDGTEYTRNGVHQGNLQYGAIVTKYMLPKERTSSGNLHQCCFRYADVILSLAEIENNLHGPTDKALSYLKMITDRAHTTNTIPSDIQESKEKFNQFLLAERGRELYFEGWRREDLIRFGEFIKNAQARGKHAKEYMEIMPIPPQVITESGGIVKNNPGYE